MNWIGGSACLRGRKAKRGNNRKIRSLFLLLLFPLCSLARSQFIHFFRIVYRLCIDGFALVLFYWERRSLRSVCESADAPHTTLKWNTIIVTENWQRRNRKNIRRARILEALSVYVVHLVLETTLNPSLDRLSFSAPFSLDGLNVLRLFGVTDTMFIPIQINFSSALSIVLD